MTGLDFLRLAERLARARTEADWRTALSRAYYAIFHEARKAVQALGFSVPRTEAAHKYLSRRRSNCGDPRLGVMGTQLDAMRTARNQADYDIHLVFASATARQGVDAAGRMIDAVNTIPQADWPLIQDAIRAYERDVLKEVTWRP